MHAVEVAEPDDEVVDPTIPAPPPVFPPLRAPGWASALPAHTASSVSARARGWDLAMLDAPSVRVGNGRNGGGRESPTYIPPDYWIEKKRGP